MVIIPSLTLIHDFNKEVGVTCAHICLQLSLNMLMLLFVVCVVQWSKASPLRMLSR